MPIIRVEMFAGRSRELKRSLAKELTEGFLRVCSGKPEGITILIEDVAKENWAVAGELMADRYAE
ncbi:MAG: tautomerase family protein [Gammaproteobacteria bacterium]